jgi:hypothetical protein
LKSQPAYASYEHRPADLPRHPEDVYRNAGCVSWGDWLGTGSVGPGKRAWRAFPEARRFAHALGPQSKEQWQELYESGRLPADIPAGPHTVYRDKGWVSWPDWLGKKWRGFPEARRFVHALGLR